MYVEIRGRQDQLQVYIKNSNRSLPMEELKQRLQPLQDLQVEVVHIFLEKMIESQEVLSLITLVNTCDMLVASISYTFQNAVIETLDAISIGHYDFYHDVLILSDIPLHTSITMYHGNMYVFGKVSGEIEFYSKKSKLYALSIYKLRLKMNDMPMQYIQEYDKCVLQYQYRKEKGIWQDQL